MSSKFPVIEIFGPTIQGEGALAGQVSHFIRLGGCPLRCTWCDSMHAVLPEEVKKNATRMSANEISRVITRLPRAKWITLSGGDPVMWNLDELMDELEYPGASLIAVETAGTLYQDWLEQCDHVTLSPKGPSSGMQDKINYSILGKILYSDNYSKCLKIVIFTEEDLKFAVDLHKRFIGAEMYLSIGTDLNITAYKEDILERYTQVCDKILTMPSMADVAVLPQLHVLMWGHQKGV